MEILHENWLQTICWTLVHSLWQGLILALLTGIVILLTRQTSAALRYNLLGFLSLAFLLTVCVTFYQVFQQTENTATARIIHAKEQFLETINSSPSNLKIHEMNVEKSQNVFAYVVDLLDRYASYIVVCWFVIFSIKCVRILRGMQEIHVLRSNATSGIPEYWKIRLQELQTRLGIQQKVQILQSARVDVPSVTGVFKPLILIPIGLLNNLPQEQVEAILLHELAHIRRNDYLVNLTQSFAEIVFFFNPAVLWLSALLRSERENCCDDLAIGVTQSKHGFVHALVSFQEYKMAAGGELAMHFSGQKTALLDRAKRVLLNSNKSLNSIEKYFIVICILLGTALSFAFSKSRTTVHSKESIAHAEAIPPDSLFPVLDLDQVTEGLRMKITNQVMGHEITTYLFKEKKVVYQVTEELDMLKVNGKFVAEKDMHLYLPTLTELVGSYIESEIRAQEMDREIAKAVAIEAESERIEAESERIEAESERIEAETERIEMESRKVEMESREIEQESRRIEHESKRMEHESRRVEAESERVNCCVTNGSETKSRVSSYFEEPLEINVSSKNDQLTSSIISDLKKYGYKGQSGSKPINAFSLSEKRLTVNGVRQSEELLKLMQKRIQPGMRISFETKTK